MNDSLSATDNITTTHGQLQIIFKSELYNFIGKYSITDDDTTVLSKTGLQFDYLISTGQHNLAIHKKDVRKVETFIHPESLQHYVKFDIRLVTSEGLVKLLAAEGKIFHVYKKTAADWKKSQDDLGRAHDLLQTVFDASPHAISVYRILYNRKGEPEDFEIVSLNASTVLTIGMRPDELIGKPFSKLFPYLKKAGVYDQYVSVATTGKRADFEITHDNRWYRFIVVRTANLLVATIEDITEVKQARNS
jgi:PAS domain-containing protein